MINGKKEIWVKANTRGTQGKVIIAFSNRGRVMQKDGTIRIAERFTMVRVNGVKDMMYKHLLRAFKPQTEDDILNKRTWCDHITHNPKDMYLNDIDNLRWCNVQENNNFEEGRLNKRKALANPDVKAKIYTPEHNKHISDAKRGKYGNSKQNPNR